MLFYKLLWQRKQMKEKKDRLKKGLQEKPLKKMTEMFTEL